LQEADNNIYHMSDEERNQRGIQVLPSNLKDAIENFRQDNVLKETFGEHTFNKFIEAKEAEIMEV